jgi:hypothetical protein
MKSKNSLSIRKITRIHAKCKTIFRDTLQKVLPKAYFIGTVSIVVLLIALEVLSTGQKEEKTSARNHDVFASTVSSNPKPTENADHEKISVLNNRLETNQTKSNAEDSWNIAKKDLSQIDQLVKKYFNVAKDYVKDVLGNDTPAEKERLAKEITKKREGIKAYKNIKTYVRKGMQKNTYVVFSTYQMKFSNIKTMAPGMCVLYVVTDDHGKLSIQYTSADGKITAYINQLETDDDIAAVIKKVNTGFQKAMGRDETLKAFVDNLKKKAQVVTANSKTHQTKTLEARSSAAKSSKMKISKK